MYRLPHTLLVALATIVLASPSPAEESLYAQALERVAAGDTIPTSQVGSETPPPKDDEDEECAEGDDCDDDEKEAKVYWKDGVTNFEMEGAHITLANRMQVRYSHLFPDDDLQLPGTTERGQSKGSFRIRRAKTTFEGWFWKPELTFELQLNWAEPEPGASTDRPLEDGYINWDASKTGAFMVRVGQFKVPLGRQEMTTSSGLQLVDRSILTFEFTRGRDIGVQFHGRVANDKLEYRAGIFNGNPASRIENDNTKFQYNVHLSYQPFGEVAYREPDFESGDKPLLAIEGEFEHNDLHGSTNATDLKTVILGAAVVFKYKGFSFFSEYFSRTRTPEEGEAWDSPGFIVQSGYFLKRDTLEVALRYATWDPNKDIADNNREEVPVGLNYYFLKHRFKLMGDFRELRNKDRGSKDQELRLQTQFMF